MIVTRVALKGILCLLACTGLIACVTAGAPKTFRPRLEQKRISRADVRPEAGLMPGEERMSKEVKLTPDLTMTATIEVTAKGNGRLRLGNLDIGIFDSHNDGQYFENGMLDVDLCDLDGDGKSEVIISGIVYFNDENGDAVLRREAVVFIYNLQRDGAFKLVYKNTALSLNRD